MTDNKVVTLILLVFYLVVMPLHYNDQRYDGIDNALRLGGVSEVVSRQFVGALYDIFPLTP